MKYGKYIFLVIYIFLVGLIFYFAGSSGESSSELSGGLTDKLIEIYDFITPTKESVLERYSYSEISNFVRKGIGHFGLFAFMGIFAAMTYIFFIKKMNIRLIVIFLSGFIIAGISEIIQIFAESRGPAFLDVLIDYSGYLISTGIIIGIMFIILKKRSKEDGKE